MKSGAGLKTRCAIGLALLAAEILIRAYAFGAQPGAIRGVVNDKATGASLPAANVIVGGTQLGAVTDVNGEFLIRSVPPGHYTLSASLIGHKTASTPDVAVAAGDTASVAFALEDESVLLGGVVVVGASRRAERITDAPAAVSVIEPAAIRMEGISGQLPKLLAAEPGVDIAQSGLYDFNINTRGFNSSLTRRLLVLLDGRDLAIAFLGAQEWNGLSVPVEDLGRLELVRGPGSALYGANAFNGVINIVSPSPREIAGTKVTVAGGELNTMRVDVRHAGSAGPWSYKINAGGFRGDSWSESRLSSFEYSGFNGLNVEVVPVDKDPVKTAYASARIDYDLAEASVVTAEGGMAQVENEIYVTGIGRIQVQKAQKPWGRMSYAGPHLNAQIWTNGRASVAPQISLASGLPLDEHSTTTQGEIQTNFSALDERLFVVAGASQRIQSVDTKGTLMLAKHADNMTGVYAQAEARVAPGIKAVAAVRWDRSTLIESEISPKGGIVWSPVPDQTFRVTYNRAFQSPNYSELFLHIRDPITRFSYFGNEALLPEEIDGFEAGYKGIFANAVFVTCDLYTNRLRNFITDLAQGVNPAYTTTDSVILSYGNAGSVTERGLEAGVNYYPDDHWTAGLNVSLFDFTIDEQSAKDALLPNAPDVKLNARLSYASAGAFEAGLSVKYVPSFDWAAGIYQGRILAYTIANLSAGYQLSRAARLGVNVDNLFDRVHYEIFGGSLLHRRAVASLTLSF